LNGRLTERNLAQPGFRKQLEHLTKGLPSGEQFRRTSLVFAPSDPDVMYALAADRSNYILGLFRSTNAATRGGKFWVDGIRTNGRCRITTPSPCIRISRTALVWGGSDVVTAPITQGGNWRRIANSQRGARDYVHSDHHALVWQEDGVIISGTMAAYRSRTNGGRNWEERSRGMVTAMFYDLDVAPSNGKDLWRGHAG